MSIVITGGRLIDPASKTDRKADLLIKDGKIAKIENPGKLNKEQADNHLDATNKLVTPGLIDIHTHLREPGFEYKEDIESGSQAAVAGGFTQIAAMPNTKPVIDNAELVEYVSRRGKDVGLCNVLPIGAVTVEQGGQSLAPLGEMRRAGAVGFSDDGLPVSNPNTMRLALEYSQDYGLPILSHAEDLSLTAGGHMHEGSISTRLGLKGIPRISDDIAISRDIQLAEYTGGKLHICHVSTKGAVEMIRQAKQRGVQITAEAAPHHFILTHEAVVGFVANAKMKPPLREEEDRLAIISGLLDGTIDAIATDHAPHSPIEKDVTFGAAAFGIIGLQTAVSLSLELHRKHDMSLLDLINRLTVGPAKVLNLAHDGIKIGAVADVTVIDPEIEWILTEDDIKSKSYNSPFLNTTLHGRAEATIFNGKIVYERSQNHVSSTD